MTQKADIAATGLAPTDELESAILFTLPVGEGAYTAIVRGANNTTGVGLVETYFGDPCLGTLCRSRTNYCHYYCFNGFSQRKPFLGLRRTKMKCGRQYWAGRLRQRHIFWWRCGLRRPRHFISQNAFLSKR